MVGILMRSLEASTVREIPSRLLDFYLARARRILPALLVMCTAVIIVSWFYLSPTKYKSLAVQVVSAIGFYSNSLFLGQSGYFDTEAKQKILLHTWSLSVEWQFYIALPLFMIAVWLLKKGRSWQGIALCSFGLISLGYCLHLTGSNPHKAFYSTFSRSWEMLVGGGVYLLSANKEVKVKWLGNVGFLVIIVSAIFFDSNTAWPGLGAIIPVSASAIILYGNSNYFWISNKVVQYLGDRSYSIYLWHWPIVVAIGFSDIQTSIASIVGGICLSLLLAELSYRFVERKAKSSFLNYERKAAFVVSLAILFSVVALGLIVRHAQGYPSRLPAMAVDLAKYRFSYKEYRLGQCFLSEVESYKVFNDCISPGSVDSPKILLWGDSHAAHLYPGLSKNLPENERLAQFTASGCPPFVGIKIDDRENCKNINGFVEDWIVNNHPDEVILSARWSRYDWKLLGKTLDFLHDNGVRKVTVFGPVPIWNGALVDIIVENLLPRSSEIPDRQKSYLISDNGVDDGVRKISEDHGVRFLSARQILCNDQGCMTHLSTKDGPVPMAWDEAHLSSQASDYLVVHSRIFQSE